jgi:hypothetical protein
VGRGFAVTSTLPVFETFLVNREPASPDAIDLLDDRIRQRYLQHRAELAAAPATRVWHRLFEKEMAFELAYFKAGGLLVAGSDSNRARRCRCRLLEINARSSCLLKPGSRGRSDPRCDAERSSRALDAKPRSAPLRRASALISWLYAEIRMRTISDITHR